MKAIATDNPLVAKKMEIDNEVMRLKILKASWENERLQLEWKITKGLPAEITKNRSEISRLESDIVLAGKNPQADFSITIENKTYDNRVDAGRHLLLLPRIHDMGSGTIREVGTLRGFTICLQRIGQDEIALGLKGACSRYSAMSDSEAGNIIRLENMIERLPAELDREKRELEQNLKQLDEARTAMQAPFEFEKRLADYAARQVEFDTKLEFDKSRQEDALADDEPKEPENLSEADGKTGDIQKQLFEAVRAGDGQRIDVLLEEGAYIDTLDEKENTPLAHAVRAGNLELSRRLLAAGADPDLALHSNILKDAAIEKELNLLLITYEKPKTKNPAVKRR